MWMGAKMTNKITGEVRVNFGGWPATGVSSLNI
jgi:hypothetical protein